MGSAESPGFSFELVSVDHSLYAAGEVEREYWERVRAQLAGDDAIALVLRAHLLLERELTVCLSQALAFPAAVRKKLKFISMVHVGRGLGLFANHEHSALAQVNTIRNVLAHIIDADVIGPDVNTLFNCLRPKQNLYLPGGLTDNRISDLRRILTSLLVMVHLRVEETSKEKGARELRIVHQKQDRSKPRLLIELGNGGRDSMGYYLSGRVRNIGDTRASDVRLDLPRMPKWRRSELAVGQDWPLKAYYANPSLDPDDIYSNAAAEFSDGQRTFRQISEVAAPFFPGTNIRDYQLRPFGLPKEIESFTIPE